MTVDPSNLTNINIGFPETFSLSGTVLDEGPDPIEGISVAVCLPHTYVCRYASSQADGAFTVTGLVADTYVVREGGIHLGYMNGWYAGPNTFTLDEGAAAGLLINTNDTVLDLRVELAPTVEGTVSGPSGVLDGIEVEFADPATGDLIDPVVTHDGGKYKFSLQPGTYILHVRDTAYPRTHPSGYLAAGGSLVADPASAQQIVMAAGSNVTGLDVTIPEGGTIDVSVASAAGPLPAVQVLVCVSYPVCVAGDLTDENGSVSFPTMLPTPPLGGYRVAIETSGRSWYVFGAPAVQDQGSATLVPVTGGATTAIDFLGTGTPTLPGVDQVVPLDDGTGATHATLTFASVDSAGTTTLTIPPSPPLVPFGFKFGDPPTFFDIQTTSSSYSGPITVCTSFDPTHFADPAQVKLFHFAGNPPDWVDITGSVTPGSPLWSICGSTESLSPFVLVETDAPPPPSVSFPGLTPPPALNDMKAGNTNAVKFTFGSNLGLSILKAGSPTSQRIDCVTRAPIGSPTVVPATLRFTKKNAVYSFNWKTDKTWKGTCRELTLTFTDDSSIGVLFKFK